MWTCEQSRTPLELEAGGEPRPLALDAHLERCAACRAERRQLLTELQGLATGLRAWVRPVEREQRVLARLARPPRPAGSGAARGEGRRLWLAAAVAALVLGLVVALRPHPGGEPGRGGTEASGPDAEVGLPPARGPVAEARAHNLRRLTLPGAFPAPARWWEASVTDGGALEPAFHLDLPPPSPTTRQRFVLEAGAVPTSAQFQAGPGGYAGLRLGRALLLRVAESPAAGAFRLGLDHEGAEALVTLSDPLGRAEARVPARLDPVYAGALLVPEGLALALGLQGFEHPAPAREGGREAWRANARIEVGGTRIEGLVLVDVAPGAIGAGEVVLDCGGAEETGLVLADSIAVSAGGSFEARGRVEALGRARDRATRLPVDRPAEGARAVLVRAGAGGLLLPRLETLAALAPEGRVTLRTLELAFASEAPGTRVRVARAWRGGTALPALEGVAFGEVEPGGRVRLPWWDGPAGAGLRVRLDRSDGTSVVRDLGAAPEEPVLSIVVGAHGGLLAAGPHGTWLRPVEDLAAALRAARAGLAPGARFVLGLEAEAEAPWASVQRVLVAAVHPEVAVDAVRFAGAGAQGTPLAWPVPRDAGLVPPLEGVVGARVVLGGVQPDGTVPVRTQGLHPEAEGVWTPPARAGASGLAPGLHAALGFWVNVARRAGQPTRVVVATPPAAGAVPYAALRDVLRALAEAGVGRILLEGGAAGGR